MPNVDSFRSVALPLRIHAGAGALDKLAEEVDRQRATRAFIVCGQSVARHTNLLERTTDALGDRLVGVFDGAEAGSPLPSVEKGAAMATAADADVIVALGGGSAVVTTRAIIVLLGEGGRVQDYATKYPPGKPPVSPRLLKPKLPNIVVLTTPTTAMTRAGTAVIDLDTGHRVELFDPKTRPCAVIWDEEALLTAPIQLCLSAAASCFSSVVGGLQTLGINPLAEGDLLQALRLLTANMGMVRKQPEDGGVRLNLTAAAYLANRSSDNGAGGGGAMAVVSSLAHSLDTRYPKCDHGSAYSVLTAPGIRFNRSYNAAGQAQLAFLMGVDTHGMDQQRSAQAAADAVENMYREAGMPLRLKDVGVAQEGIQQIAEDSMTDFGLHRNVRPVEGAQELVELLQEIW